MATLSPALRMYRRGLTESVKERSCDTWSCACTLTYWSARLGSDPNYNAFLDGWSDAANGEREYEHLYTKDGQ